MQWDGPVIPGTWVQGHGGLGKRIDCFEFEASLVYTANSRSTKERPCVKQRNSPCITNPASLGKYRNHSERIQFPMHSSVLTLSAGEAILHGDSGLWMAQISTEIYVKLFQVLKLREVGDNVT